MEQQQQKKMGYTLSRNESREHQTLYRVRSVPHYRGPRHSVTHENKLSCSSFQAD